MTGPSNIDVVAPNRLSTAADAWALLAPRIAGRGRVRVSRDGGKNYPRRYERPVTAALPSQPAAVLIFDTNGCAPVFVVDLDAAKAIGGTAGPGAALERDYRALLGLLERTGLTSWFSDHSPNGGRHVYVPLAEPVPYADAKEAIGLLSRRLPSVDPLPLASIASGCIRPPGARHKSGGHQVLDGSLDAACASLDAPNPVLPWKRFLAELRRHNGRLVAPAPREDLEATSWTSHDEGTRLEPLPGFTEPSAAFQSIAVTGDYPTGRYASPSEARQGVVWAAAAAGWALSDVARRLADGTWPGLASMYARYQPNQRHTSLARDWHRAQAFEKRRREAHQEKSVRVCTTSPLKSQRGAVPTAGRGTGPVREWLAAVDLVHGPDSDLGTRAVLYALAEASVLTGNLVIEHGNRSLAIATGLDRSTVGRILLKLVGEPSDRALIEKVKDARGIYANTYQLRIPTLLRAACAAKPWRPGRIHAIRPVFRDLGLPAAFVYAALEQHRAQAGPIGGRELAALARVGVTATYEALQTLATHGLAERVAGGWKIGDASLAQLAEAWGILDAIRDQVARYRAERIIWRTWLAARGLISPVSLTTVPRRLPTPPPPGVGDPPARTAWFDDNTGLMTLLEAVLGAEEISA